jgi:hypothetical protein
MFLRMGEGGGFFVALNAIALSLSLFFMYAIMKKERRVAKTKRE